MKEELELTVELPYSLEEAKSMLENQGFSLEETGILEDLYMKPKVNDHMALLELLNDSILIRKEGNYFTGFVLKKKRYNGDGTLQKDQKLYLKVEDLKQGKTFLELIGYEAFVFLKQDIYRYRKETIDLLLQDVKGLGIFLEYEAKNKESIEKMKQTLNEVFGMEFENYYERKIIRYIEKYGLILKKNSRG